MAPEAPGVTDKKATAVTQAFHVRAPREDEKKLNAVFADRLCAGATS